MHPIEQSRPTDEELVCRSRNDHRAAVELQSRHYKPLCIALKKRFRSSYSIDIESIAITAIGLCINACLRSKRSNRMRRFRAYLYTIAKNMALEELRKFPDVPMSPEDVDIRREAAQYDIDDENLSALSDTLTTVLSRLREADRAVLVDHYIHQMSYEEIAVRRNTSTAAIKERVYRAKKRLRLEMEAFS